MKNKITRRCGKPNGFWVFLLLSGCFCSRTFCEETNRPPPFLGSNANYSISAPSSNRMVQISTNDQSAGDDNLVWSHSGRYIAADRSDPMATNQLNQLRGPKYICVLDVGNMGNIQTIGARTSAFTNPVFANITEWTWDDRRVLFGFWPTNLDSRCRVMSCLATGAMNVVNFLFDTNPPPNNLHVFSPSVIFDPTVNKERLLFLTATGPDPAAGNSTVNVWTVTYDVGGVPDWTNRVPLTSFNTNSRIQAVRWSPELNTNYQPLINRYAIVKRTPGPGKEIIVFNGVQGILSQATPVVTNFNDGRLSLRDGNASGSSQVTWTYDGARLMYSREPFGPTSELFTVRSAGTNLTTAIFPTPAEFNGSNKQWLCVNPGGTRVAFTVNKRIYMLPLVFSNAAVTNAGSTNIISDGGYTRAIIPASALTSDVSFTITEPNSVDSNQFSGDYLGGAREFSAEGVTNQFNFATNVEMYLQYSSSDLPTNVSPTNLSIYLYNSTNVGIGGATGTWGKVSSMTDTNNQYIISTNITHFSIYALGAGHAPAAPINVSASQGTYTNMVRVTWSASVGASGYVVWTNMANSTSTAAQAISGLSTTAWNDTNGGVVLTYYWVQATNDDGAGPLSSPAAPGWRSANANISVRGTNNAVIASGEFPNTTNGTHFGFQTVSGASLTNTFSITNSGSSALQILYLTTNGAGAAYFRVDGMPAFVATSAVPSNFVVVFNRSVPGLHTAVVTIANNSTNVPTYQLNLRGVSGGEIGLSTTTLAFTGTYNGTNPTAQTFIITNLNQTGFTFSNVVTYSSGASGWLSILPVGGNVAGNGGQVVTASVTIAGLNAGNFTATNDCLSTNAFSSGSKTLITATIGKANQAVSFPAIPDQIATSTVTLSATSDSSLPVSFTVGSGSATISGGNLLTFSGAGSVSIVASQAGNSNWNAALNMTNTFTVSKASQAISFPAIADQVTTSRVTLAATAGSGLAVSFNVAGGPGLISDGNILSFTRTGLVRVAASQDGNALWNAAVNVTNNVNVRDVSTLAAPQNLAASDGTYTDKVALSWSAVSGGSGYQVWRAGENNAAAAANLGNASLTAYDDDSSAARAATRYYYWVKAWNSAATSEFSNVDGGFCRLGANPEIVSGQPVVGDYDTDGKADPAVYDLASGHLYVWLSSAGYTRLAPVATFQVSTGDLPLTADFDGDGASDPGVFEPATGSWYVWISSAGYNRVGPFVLGLSADDIPIPADYDADAKADPAVYQSSSNSWYVWPSSYGYVQVGPLTQFHVGAIDIPVPGRYDTDGRADPAVYQAVEGAWYVWMSSSGYGQFGPAVLSTTNNHIAVAADYDGDGLCDPAAYLPTLGKWRIWMSGNNYTLTEMELR